MGRKPKITPEVVAYICELIGKRGATDKTAYTLAGISKTAFYDALNQGEAAKTGWKREFFVAVEKAREEWELLHLDRITAGATEGSIETRTTVRKVGDKEFRERVTYNRPPSTADSKWLLERRYPERYGRRVLDQNVTGEIENKGKPFEVVVVPPPGADEVAEALGESEDTETAVSEESR